MGYYVSIEERRSARRRRRQDELDWRKRRSPLTNFNGSVIDLLKILPKDRPATHRPDVVVTRPGTAEVSPKRPGLDPSRIDAAMERYGLGSPELRAAYQRRIRGEICDRVTRSSDSGCPIGNH